MDDATVEIKVGKVESLTTEMSVRVAKKSDGKQEILLYMSEKRGRRYGELLILDLEQFAELKKVLVAAEAHLSQVTGPETICPNCKTPRRNQTGADTKNCAFCGYVQT